MKRTLTGIAAASMVLGTIAPMALAATSSTQWQYNTFNINGKAAISNVPSMVSGNTTYISVYDMQQYLDQLGYNATWNFNTMNITVSGNPDTTSLPQVGGNAMIQVNGATVMKMNHIVAQPKGWAQPSSFVPIYDFQLLLNALGINQQWDGVTHTWSATVSAPKPAPVTITTGVAGIVTNASGTAVSGATVTVGTNTATTDSHGYYQIAAAPGQDQVTVSAKGYFDNTSTVVVTANQLTGDNVQLGAVNPAMLQAVVTVDNSQTGASVSGATVDLETTAGTVLASGTTHANGVITFANTGVTTAVNPVNFQKYGKDVNQLEAGTSYKVVVTDAFASGNTTGAYNESDVTMTTSMSSATTDVGVGLTPVKKADVAATIGWASKDTLPTSPVTISLLSATGTTISSTTVTDPTTISSTVTKGFDNLTIPTGNYILKVNDGTNAIEYKGISVQEGVNSNTSITVNPAQQLNVNAEYAQYPTGETPSGNVTINAVETINGQAITVSSVTNAVHAVTTGSTQFEATGTLNRLDAGSYTLTASGSYVLGNPSTNYTVVSGEVGTANISMQPAADLAEKVAVSGVTGNSAVPVTIKVTGQTNSSTTVSVVNSGSLAATVSSTTNLQLPQGTYTVTVSAPGYQTQTVSGVTLTDFTTTTPAGITLLPVTSTAVSGYVRYSGTDSLVNSGTVSLYTLTDTYVSSTTIGPNGMYSFPGTVTPGSYELVVRGPGNFNTSATPISVTQGTNTDPVWVTKGGQAADYVTVFNGNGSLYSGTVTSSGTISGLVAQDSWYDPSATIASGQPAQPGQYYYMPTSGLTTGKVQPGVFETMGLSAGSYTVSLSGSTVHFQVNSDATAQEKLALTSTVTGPTYLVSGFVSNSADTEVVALNSQNQVVATQHLTSGNLASGSFSLSLPDGTYTIVAIQNNAYVASQSVTVNNVPVTLSTGFVPMPAMQ